MFNFLPVKFVHKIPYIKVVFYVLSKSAMISIRKIKTFD